MTRVEESKPIQNKGNNVNIVNFLGFNLLQLKSFKTKINKILNFKSPSK